MPPKQDRPKTDPTQAQWLTDEFEKKLIKLFEKAKGQLKDLLPEDDAKTNAVAPNVIKSILGKVDKTFEGIRIDAESIIEEEIPKGYQHGERYASIQLGASPEVRKIAWTKIGNRVINTQSDFKKITDATAGTIRSTIADGIINERKFSEITRDILRNVDGIGIVRAETMVRSEIMQAVNAGVKDRYEKDDVDEFERLEADDELTCDDWPFDIFGRTFTGCAELDGEIFTREEADEVDNQTHPNCVLPDTLCHAEDIVGALRVWYSGPVIQILLKSGRGITVSPNHMFLTPYGFASADLLREGDNIIQCTSFEGEFPTINPDKNRNPSRIDDIFCSLNETSGMFSRNVPSTPKDLHGDGVFGKGDIDIIWSDGLLRDANNITLLKPSAKDSLNPARDGGACLNTDSPITQLLKSMAHTTDGGMSGFRVPAPCFRRRLRHTYQHGFMPVPDNNSHFTKSACNDRPRYTERFCNVIQRFTRLIPFDNFRNIYTRHSAADGNIMGHKNSKKSITLNMEFLREEAYRNALKISLDEIINVKILSFHGYIYDLQTTSTLFLANSYVVSNCRGTWIPHIRIPTIEKESD